MKSAIVNIITATALTLSTPLKGVEVRKESSGVALELSGANRSEWEAALSKAKGSDTEFLPTHASQYDLVSLTAEMIVENITYARKVHEALPYLGEKLDEELWREWVLPQRVLEEDLSLWRKDFYEKMQPVTAGKETTAEVAEAIRAWLWGMDADSVKRVKFQNAENRLRSPVEILCGGVAACGELAVLHISFLRAVGIPARHCCTGWYQGGKDGWHFYTEYWDNQKKCWVAINDVAVPPSNRVKSGNWSTFATYAAPGFNECANAYYTEDFSKLIGVTANLGEVAPFHSHADGSNDGSAAISVWNALGWRKVAIPEAAAKEGTDYNFSLVVRISQFD
jgi:hypothetical protein